MAQKELEDNFKENPRDVATQFMDVFDINSDTFDTGFAHLKYSESHPYEVKKWDKTFLGPESVVSMNFCDGAFSSASLDIGGD